MGNRPPSCPPPPLQEEQASLMGIEKEKKKDWALMVLTRANQDKKVKNDATVKRRNSLASGEIIKFSRL